MHSSRLHFNAHYVTVLVYVCVCMYLFFFLGRTTYFVYHPRCHNFRVVLGPVPVLMRTTTNRCHLNYNWVRGGSLLVLLCYMGRVLFCNVVESMNLMGQLMVYQLAPYSRPIIYDNFHPCPLSWLLIIVGEIGILCFFCNRQDLFFYWTMFFMFFFMFFFYVTY